MNLTGPVLLQLVVDSGKADDWLSSGAFALSIGDVELAERLLARAGQMGADVGPYLSSLAASSFDEAATLLKAKKFTEASGALDAIERKYSATPWFRAHHVPITAAQEAAKSGIYESAAEQLYAEAAKRFEEKELFDVRDLVEKLKADYPQSAAVTDASRTPLFSEMAEAVVSLGRKLTVRLDGRGDFKSIQEAIDAAAPRSVIEIQDNGPYNEKLLLPSEKPGLTLRGARTCWPVITSAGDQRSPNAVVRIEGMGARLTRLVILNLGTEQLTPQTIGSSHKANAVQQVIIYSRGYYCGVFAGGKYEQCLFLTRVKNYGGKVCTDCVFLKDVSAPHDIALQHCTVLGSFHPGAATGVASDSILRRVSLDRDYPEVRVESCALLEGPVPDSLDDCFVADPEFMQPALLDLRLKPTSPCRGKATNGGDLGVRFTPEMIEMLKLALELRARGVIKF